MLIANYEGKKRQVNIAQIKEIIRVLPEVIKELNVDEVVSLIIYLLKPYFKKFKK
ncbi:MAG: hypothetical protein QXO40_00155 [Candidatus Aenigmatarchaeota archaeon]